jgi:hypothetical protein
VHFRGRSIAVGALTIIVFSLGVAVADAGSSRYASRTPAPVGPLIAVGHDNVKVDPALRRFTGLVTALGNPDSEGRIFSFQAAPLGPDSAPPAPNELRGWRLTLLAGKRFSNVFEVSSNTPSELTVSARDGPLNGLAVNDVFIVEEIATAPSPQAAPGTGT